jgi:hypothetical protein
MAIKFNCPHCNGALAVKDSMAGKRGPCPRCKKEVRVPAAPPAPVPAPAPTTNGPSSNGSATHGAVVLPSSAPSPDAVQPAAPSPADLEAEAAALLSDAPRQEEPAEVKTIEFTCAFCGEKVQLSAELAGKKAPCPNPECRRIIKVPELQKQEKKDWRKAPPNLPAGAKKPDEPAPEGAWGSAAATSVSRQALEEAEAVPETRPPLSRMQKLRPWLLGAGAVGVLAVGVLLVLSWVGRNKEKAALQRALDYAKSEGGRKALGPLGEGALHLGAGEYFLHKKDSAKAREHFGLALTGLRAGSGAERDALLGELAAIQVELGGAGEEVQEGKKLPWNETQKTVRAALTSIGGRPAGLEALRGVARRLIARGQPERVLPLTAQVYSTPGAARQEALAVAGLEFLSADRKAEAEKAADQALAGFSKKGKLSPGAAVVALAVALGRTPPEKGPGLEAREDYRAGRAEGLARAGNWEEARKEARKPEAVAAKVRGLLALAAVAAQTKNGDTTDADAASQLLGEAPSPSWAVLRLAGVGSAGGLPAERLQTLADAIPNASLRAWGQLLVLRAHLSANKGTADVGLTDKIDPQSLSFLLARQELARHNAGRSSGWASTVDRWEENARAFGWVGVARGLSGEK